MPLLTLDSVALSYGHLPLFDAADLRIESGERIALIGRNGSGKSSLLKVVSGEVAPDAGTVWRSPGLRVARLEQDVSAFAPRSPRGIAGESAANRSVFDEVADGLGALGEIVAAYHHAAVDVADRGDPETLCGSATCNISSKSVTAGGSSRKWNWSSRAWPSGRRLMGELSGGWRRRALLGKALVSEPDSCCSMSPPITSTSTRSAGSKIPSRFRRRHPVRDTRPGISVRARNSNCGARSRPADLVAGKLCSVPPEEGGRPQCGRSWRRLDKKLEKEEAWLRQGVKARRTRNEGRVRDLLKLREERAAYRAETGPVRMSVDTGDATGRLVFEAKHVSKAFAGVPVIRDYSQRILRGDRVGLSAPMAPARRRCSGCSSESSSPMPE